MAGRWRDFGLYGADGMSGGDALGVGIERMVTGIQTSPDSERGVHARLRYLTASTAGYGAMERAGIDVNTRTLAAWLAEERMPNRANRVRLDSAYWDLRRHNVAVDLKRRLGSRGGTRVEIDPVDQSGVARKHRRDLTVRHHTIRARHWHTAVDAWLADDAEALRTLWDEITPGLGSDYDSYSYVSSIGWAA